MKAVLNKYRPKLKIKLAKHSRQKKDSNFLERDRYLQRPIIMHQNQEKKKRTTKVVPIIISKIRVRKVIKIEKIKYKRAVDRLVVVLMEITLKIPIKKKKMIPHAVKVVTEIKI